MYKCHELSCGVVLLGENIFCSCLSAPKIKFSVSYVGTLSESRCCFHLPPKIWVWYKQGKSCFSNGKSSDFYHRHYWTFFQYAPQQTKGLEGANQDEGTLTNEASADDSIDWNNANPNLKGVIDPFHFFSVLWTEQRTTCGSTSAWNSGVPSRKLLAFRQQRH